MTLAQLIEHLQSIGGAWLDKPVYIRYDDDNLLHGQLVRKATVVTVCDVGIDRNLQERVVLNGTHRD